MAHQPFDVLFNCTGNSARSIFAESLINRLGSSAFRGYSACSHPRGEIHPLALRELKHNNLKTHGLSSKNWEEFVGPDAPPMDFVFTVCDAAASEACPAWPGQPVTAHRGVADPVAAEGEEWEKRAALHRAFADLENRVAIFVNLPIRSMDGLTLQQKLDEIDRMYRDGLV